MNKFVSLVVGLGAMLVLISIDVNSRPASNSLHPTIQNQEPTSTERKQRFICVLDTGVTDWSGNLYVAVHQAKEYHVAGQQWEFHFGRKKDLRSLNAGDVVTETTFFYTAGKGACNLLNGIMILTEVCETDVEFNDFGGRSYTQAFEYKTWNSYATITTGGGWPKEENYKAQARNVLNDLADIYKRYSR